VAYHEWLAALLLAAGLSRMGALPKTIPLAERAAYARQEVPLRIGIAQRAQAIKVTARGPAGIALIADDGESSVQLGPGQSVTERPDQDGIAVEMGGTQVRVRRVLITAAEAPRPRASIARLSIGAELPRPRASIARLSIGAELPRPRASIARLSIGAELPRPRASIARLSIGAGGLEVSSWGEHVRSGVYPGAIEVMPDASGGLSAVNIVPLERYLEGVVATEMPLSFHPEALKAQAIIARTWALFNLGKHAAQGWDLCDLMHCQQYRGATSDPRARRAVRETAGQVLAYRECLAETVYHTTCGGFTDDSYSVWYGYLMPYLRARPDLTSPSSSPEWISGEAEAAQFVADKKKAYCDSASLYRWQRSYTAGEAQQLIEANLPLLLWTAEAPGRLLDMTVEGRSRGGRVQTLRVVTEGPPGAGGQAFELKRDHIRWLFGDGKPGPGGLPSTLFVLHVKRDRNGSPTQFVFDGAGWGHGLGLCQCGANGRARAGASAREILQYYYPGTRVVDLARRITGSSAGNREEERVSGGEPGSALTRAAGG
jgi:SpoIID/LytB domain protein